MATQPTTLGSFTANDNWNSAGIPVPPPKGPVGGISGVYGGGGDPFSAQATLARQHGLSQATSPTSFGAMATNDPFLAAQRRRTSGVSTPIYGSTGRGGGYV